MDYKYTYLDKLAMQSEGWKDDGYREQNKKLKKELGLKDKENTRNKWIYTGIGLLGGFVLFKGR